MDRIWYSVETSWSDDSRLILSCLIKVFFYQKNFYNGFSFRHLPNNSKLGMIIETTELYTLLSVQMTLILKVTVE